jgi:hypothetical protein
MRGPRIKKARPTVHVAKCFDLFQLRIDRLKIVSESILALGCAHTGGNSKYAISCVCPTAASPTPPPPVAYALSLRDRRISIHNAALCVRHSFRLTGTASV